MAGFSVDILANINTDEVKKKIESLSGTKITLNNIDTSGLAAKIQAELDKGNFSLKIDNVNMKNLSQQATQAGKAAGQNFSRSMSSAIEKISSNKALKDVTAALSGYSALGGRGNKNLSKIEEDIKILEKFKASFVKGVDINVLADGFPEVEASLKRITNYLSVVKTEAKGTISALQVTSLSNKMDTWLEKNSLAVKDYGDAIRKLQSELNGIDRSSDGAVAALNRIDTEFKEIQQSAIAAGKTGISWASQFQKAFKSIANYVSVSSILYKGIETAKEMAANVKAIDSSMAGLQRVANLTETGQTKLFDKMSVSAKNYGATLTDIIDSVTEWSKLGFDTETSSRLAEITTMYQHVTDLDNSTAVENLVTAYKGFQDQLTELYNGDEAAAIEYISDVYNELGNRFAEGAEDVGNGLSKSAAVLSQGGASLQEAAGMFTGIQEVLQDSSTSGTALKILTLRIRGMRGELQELGEDIEGVESISKIQTQLLNLTDGRVNIFDDEGNFRNIYDIMDDIAEVYYELTDTGRADLLEIIAGKNRSNAVQALISNWSRVEEATKAAYEAEGSAAAENAVYMDTIEGRMKVFEASWQNLSKTLVSSDFLKGLVDSGTSALDTIDSIVSAIEVIPTVVGVAAGSMSLFKNVGRANVTLIKK